MSKQRAVDILKKHNQRITHKRVILLEFLINNPKAFTQSEIEKHLSGSMDRVTVYRILQVFEAVGFVLKMVDSKGVCMYMLNLEKHKKLSTHPHLHCRECNEIICLPCLPAEYLEMLGKYEIDEMYFLMCGKCNECSATEKGKHAS